MLQFKSMCVCVLRIEGLGRDEGRLVGLQVPDCAVHRSGCSNSCDAGFLGIVLENSSCSYYFVGA